jgi:hypothetical protein
MVYTFADTMTGKKLEVFQDEEDAITISINYSFYYLDKNDLYDLIGALHSLQGKMKGGYKS